MGSPQSEVGRGMMDSNRGEGGAHGFDPSRKHHDLLAVGEIPCKSCPSKWPFPARYMASAKRIDGLPPTDWPVCEEHSQYAMVAGWFPLRTIDEWRSAAIAQNKGAAGSSIAWSPK